jgi:hypothetical protein
LKRSALVLISASVLTGTAWAYVIPPEPLLDLGGGVEALTGAWTAVASPPGKTNAPAPTVKISLRQGHRTGEAPHSLTCALTELRNLAPDEIVGAGADVSFEVARDAGTLRFAGRFQSGEGTGHWSFVPSGAYLAGMRTLGYPVIDTEKVFALALLDVSRHFVEELAATGHTGLALEQLVALRVHGADASFIRALKALGYDYLSADRLVAFRIHGVSPEFITQMKAVGYSRLGPYDLVSLRANGVDAGYVRELIALGYRGVAPADLVNLRLHGITVDFVRRANAARKTAVPVARLVDLRMQDRQH